MMKPLRNVICLGLTFILLLGLFVFSSWNCSNPKDYGKYIANARPVTRLSNIPPPKDTTVTKNARLTLNWVGDDPDGYVVGFKYRWSFRPSKQDPFQYKKYKIILNIIVKEFALIANTEDEKTIPAVYKYFATLPPEGLDGAKTDSLALGDTVYIAGVGVFASNPDSVRVQSTGLFVKYRFPVHENPNSGTFIFDSQDTLNFHTFEIAAIDNLGELSEPRAMVSFETPQVVPPHTEITEWPADSSFVLLKKTDTFFGIRFAFRGTDPNSRTIDYQWVIDRDQWPIGQVPWSEFSQSEEAYITAADFPDPYASQHTFYVRSRNEFGSIDTIGVFTRTRYDLTTGDSVGIDTIRFFRPFQTLYPLFARKDIDYKQRILFINNSYEPKPPAGVPNIYHPSRQAVSNYFVGLMRDIGKPDSIIDTWYVEKDPPDGRGFPTRAILGKYSLVIMSMDGVDASQSIGGDDLKVTPERKARLRDYSYVGGKTIFSGWALRGAVNTYQSAGDEFFNHVWHISDAIRGNVRDTAFIGAIGQINYPNLNLDSTKMDPLWRGALMQMWLTFPVGFGEIIYEAIFIKSRLRPRPDQYDQIPEHPPIGVRYRGITFDCVFFGFPLYYMERDGALGAIRRALEDVSELNR